MSTKYNKHYLIDPNHSRWQYPNYKHRLIHAHNIIAYEYIVITHKPLPLILVRYQGRLPQMK